MMSSCRTGNADELTAAAPRPRREVRRLGGMVAALAALAAASVAPAGAAEGHTEEVPGLIVSYADGVSLAEAEDALDEVGVRGADLRDAGPPELGIRTMTLGRPVDAGRAEQVAARLESSPAVRWAEPDYVRSVPDPVRAPAVELDESPAGEVATQSLVGPALATQQSPPWGLDRIDQRSGLDERYTFDTTGAGVTAYVVDTGIRATHADFEGRVSAGHTSVADGRGTADCNGHGTHVAGTVGGAFSGAAKRVTLVPVRVMDCAGEGLTSTIIEGISWIIENHRAGVPAVANLSIGGDASIALDSAVAALVRDGVTVVAAAGNEAQAACNVSPARLPEVITVGSSSAVDVASEFSNAGGCLDLYAPGEGILSAYYTSDTSGAFASGTSMAAPHVTGVAARILQASPSSSPAQVHAAIVSSATGVDLAPAGSPDRLLYARTATLNVPEPVPAPAPEPTTDPTVPAPSPGERLAGADRYGTSAAISASAYARPAPLVYVASGTSFADSLAGAPVAALAGAPLLLVPRESGVPAAVADELRELRPEQVVILGGPASVSSATAAQLAQLTGAEVSRLAGADRYSTAATISAASYEADVPVVYVAGGYGTADALAGAPAAGSPDGGPLLLVDRDGVPGVIADELRRLSPGRVVVLGGPSAVSAATADALAELTGAPTSRLAGADRYATAARISSASFDPDVPAVYVANGTAFADALSGAPLAGMQDAPVLLVTRDGVPPAVAAELRRLSPARVVVLGGTNVVSASLAAELDGYAEP